MAEKEIKEIKNIKELCGSVRFTMFTQKIKDEMREGWN